jgi:hypothetical protein
MAVGPTDRLLNQIANAAGVNEIQLTLPALSTIFLDSSTVLVNGAKKTVYLVVATTLTWVTSGQALWQPFVGRTGFLAAGGATSQITGLPFFKLGAAQNLGSAAQTSLPIGSYRLSAGAVAELQYPDPQIGMEFQFPSALTAGAAALYVEAST